MARNGTFDSKRAEARVLFDQGLSCNAIAKKLQCSPSTISRWAKAEGLSFDRTKVEAAVKAHTVDLAAERVLLAQELMSAAREGLRELSGPFLVYSFGGKDNDYNEHTLDKAPPSVRRELMTAGAIAFDKVTKVLEKSTEGLDSAVSLVDRILDKFEQSAPPAPDGE